MAAAADSSNEDGSTSEEDESEKQIRHISGDDLGDSFSHDAKQRTEVGWIEDFFRRKIASNPQNGDASSGESEEEDDDDEEEEEEEAEGSDEDHVENGKGQSLKDWEQSDDENIETDLEEEEDDHDDDTDDATAKRVKKVDLKRISESICKPKDSAGAHRETVKEESLRKGELPYTIEAPKDFEELTTLFENRSDDQIVEAIRRIRTFNAIAIAAENRKKMQVRHFVVSSILFLFMSYCIDQ